jgi:transposase-like protein
MPGGRNPYLSDMGLIKFREQALERAQELRCVTVYESVTIVAALKQERVHQMAEILRICRVFLHHHLITEVQPSRVWVYEIAKMCQMRITTI